MTTGSRKCSCRWSTYSIKRSSIDRPCGLLDLPRIETRELAHPGDRLIHIPYLVGVDHQLAVGSDLFANDAHPSHVVVQVAPHFHLEVGPALSQARATQRAQLLV